MTDRVNEEPNVTGVPVPGMAESQPGVPAAPAEGMAGQGVADVETLRTELEAANAKVSKQEGDMDRLRSSYDQRYSQDLASAKSDATRSREAMQQAVMANLDDADKLVYERDIERERRLELEGELQVSRDKNNAVSSMNNYAQGFMKMGVQYEDLDFSSPDNLYASGWKGVMQVQDGLKTRVSDLEALGVKPADAQEPVIPAVTGVPNTVAPPIMAQHGEAPQGTKTIQDVVKALNSQYPTGNFTEDKVIEYVQRGQFPVTILEGVDWDRSVLGG